ncbi:MAG: DNA-processing protein DprA, partial [Candidatus Omnitrophica bacterium]|nr:DNA-processing protein DprA [Candidatus Omnitrophota bacterium]
SAVKRGKTVAVLGSGLCNIYPRENTEFIESVVSCGKGALISEFALKEAPLRENFPRRNRIVSGLSRGVLVVEAALKSGALITARLACEQNREVFALPGEVHSPLSRGTHQLIKEGAKLVESVEDILEEFAFNFSSVENKPKAVAPEESVILSQISSKGVHFEEIVVKTELDRSFLGRAVLELQFKGLIKEVRPSFYVRSTL